MNLAVKYAIIFLQFLQILNTPYKTLYSKIYNLLHKFITFEYLAKDIVYAFQNQIMEMDSCIFL